MKTIVRSAVNLKVKVAHQLLDCAIPKIRIRQHIRNRGQNSTSNDFPDDNMKSLAAGVLSGQDKWEGCVNKFPQMCPPRSAL